MKSLNPKQYFVFCALAIMFIAACTPRPTVTPVAPDNPVVAGTQVAAVRPESDNNYQWDYRSVVAVDTQVYTIMIEVYGNTTNYSETNGSISGIGFSGYSSMSGRIWQDGKGILPIILKSVSPSIAGLEAGRLMIIKTTDLKAMALEPGYITEFKCNLDNEVISPVTNGQILTTDRQTYEFDDCRMTDGTFVVNSTQVP